MAYVMQADAGISTRALSQVCQALNSWGLQLKANLVIPHCSGCCPSVQSPSDLKAQIHLHLEISGSCIVGISGVITWLGLVY